MIIPGHNPAITPQHVRQTITFDGTAGGGEAGTAVDIFTISGRVELVRFTQFCSTLLTESGATATIECGTASNTNELSAQMNAVDIDANEWVSAGGTAAAGANRSNANRLLDGEPTVVSEDIVYTIGTTNVTAGVIVIDAWYIPVTDGATLTAA